jgi:hypothetical protein
MEKFKFKRVPAQKEFEVEEDRREVISSRTTATEAPDG